MSKFPTFDSILYNDISESVEGPLNKNESLSEFVNDGLKNVKLCHKNQPIESYKYIVYILSCVDNKYYVGITKNDNLVERLKSHYNGIGSVWTQKYHPIKVIESYYENDKFQEHIWFLKTCNKYGIDNVRGASYVNLYMSIQDKDCIKREIMNALDKCFICGNEGHYSKECPNKIAKINERKRKNEDNLDRIILNIKDNELKN